MFTKLNSNIHNKLHGFQIFVLSPHINRFDTLVKCLIQALFLLFSFSLSLFFFLDRPNWGLPWQLSSKASICNARDAGDWGLIPGWEGSPGGGHGNPLQYSCLENPMDRVAWWATVHRIAKSRAPLSMDHMRENWLTEWGLVQLPNLSLLCIF